MSGFNFGQIGDVLSDFMDSDFIDIKRDSGGKLHVLTGSSYDVSEK